MPDSDDGQFTSLYEAPDGSFRDSGKLLGGVLVGQE